MPVKRKAVPAEEPPNTSEPEVLPEYDEEPDPPTAYVAPLPVVRVWALTAAASVGSEYPAEVKPVRFALMATGHLDSDHVNGGRFDKAVFAAYARWQHSLGQRGPAANGIPEKASLLALAARTGLFTVVN